MKSALPHLFLALFSLFAYSKILAQNWHPNFGASAAAMGETAIHQKGGAAAFNNPAMSADLSQITATSSFANRYGLAEFTSIGFGLLLPTEKGCISTVFTRFGDGWFNQQRFGLGFAHSLDGVHLGMRANLLQVSMEGAGTAATVSFDFGVSTQLTSSLRLGAYGFNLGQAQLASPDPDGIPSQISIGIVYQPIDAFECHVEAVKDIRYPPNFHLGISYALTDSFILRAGTIAPAHTLTFGWVIKVKSLCVAYAFGNDFRLGQLHQASLTLPFGTNLQHTPERKQLSYP